MGKVVLCFLITSLLKLMNCHQLDSLFNHFLNNCHDIAIPEVPAKNAKRSTFSKFVVVKDGMPFVQSTDKKKLYPAWLMSQAFKPGHTGRRKTNPRPKF